MQETEHDDAIRRTDIDAAVGDHGRDEFVVGEDVAGVRRLIAIVKLRGEVRRVVGVQDAGAILIFYGPHDGIQDAV